MGHYTRLSLDVRLRSETPATVIEILSDPQNFIENASGATLSRFVCEEQDPAYRQYLPQHPLFLTQNWPSLVYGNGTALSDARKSELVKKDDGIWMLSVHTALKNYGDEITKFLDWLSPFVIDDSMDKCGEVEFLDYAWEREPDVLVFGAGGFEVVEGRRLDESAGPGMS